MDKDNGYFSCFLDSNESHDEINRLKSELESTKTKLNALRLENKKLKTATLHDAISIQSTDSASTKSNQFSQEMQGVLEELFIKEQDLIFEYYNNMKINNFGEAVNIANKLISFSFLKLRNVLKKLNKIEESTNALKLAMQYDENNEFLHLDLEIKDDETKENDDDDDENNDLLQFPSILQCYEDVHKLFGTIFKDIFNKNDKVITHYKTFTEPKKNIIDKDSGLLKVYKSFADSKCPQYVPNDDNYKNRLFTFVETIYSSSINNDLKVSSRRFFAKIPGGYCWSSLLGNILSFGLERHPGFLFASPTVTGIHDCCINWFCEWFGYKKYKSSGYLATGGSLANNIGVLTARDWKLKQNPKKYQIEKFVCYISNHTHGVVRKGLLNNGIKLENMRLVTIIDKTDIVSKIETDIKNGYIPFLIASTCGDTSFGECDNLLLINEICKKYNIWHHCDAAYAGPFIIIKDDENIQNQFKGINECDSIVFDPHKSFFICNGVGCILIKNKDNLLSSCNGTAASCPLYKAEETKCYNLTNRYNEMTRNVRAISIWLPLQVHGTNKFKNTLKHLIFLTNYLCQKIINDEYCNKYIEIYTEPSFSIFTFRLKSKLYIESTQQMITLNERQQINYNKFFLDEINKKGFIALSGVNSENAFLLRICILNIRANKVFIDEVFQYLKQKIQSVLNLLTTENFDMMINGQYEEEEQEKEKQDESNLVKLVRTNSISYRREMSNSQSMEELMQNV